MKLWPFGKPARPKPFTCLEYWLYLPRKKLPPQAAYLARMQRVHPFNPGEPPPITASEAQLFSDIRLHIGLILREKNVHVFRPDLFENHVEPSPEALVGLAESVAFAKIQFLSLDPVRGDRHLRFVPYLAEAIGELTKCRAVFDVVSESLMTFDEFKGRLAADVLAESPSFHARSIWIRTENGGYGATRGLVKIGIPELETPESASDHRVLILEVLDSAIRDLWQSRTLPWPSMQTQAFDDTFDLQVEPSRRGPAQVRIHRIHR